MAAIFGRLSEAGNCASRANLAMRVEILRQAFGKNLDGDFPIQLGVGRAIDFAHPALTELRFDA